MLSGPARAGVKAVETGQVHAIWRQFYNSPVSPSPSGAHRGPGCGGVAQLKSQERARGFGRTDDWADRAQRRMPIPAFVPKVPAAGVLRFRDSAGAE